MKIVFENCNQCIKQDLTYTVFVLWYLGQNLNAQQAYDTWIVLSGLLTPNVE